VLGEGLERYRLKKRAEENAAQLSETPCAVAGTTFLELPALFQ
jgi:hypothetical protein